MKFRKPLAPPTRVEKDKKRKVLLELVYQEIEDEDPVIPPDCSYCQLPHTDEEGHYYEEVDDDTRAKS